MILAILQRAQSEEIEIVGSEILNLEIDQMRDQEKKLLVKELYGIAKSQVSYSEKIKLRAKAIAAQSHIRTFDSLHIAAAEEAGADILLTTDDRLEKMAAKLNLGVRVINPLKFALEAI